MLWRKLGQIQIGEHVVEKARTNTDRGTRWINALCAYSDVVFHLSCTLCLHSQGTCCGTAVVVE